MPTTPIRKLDLAIHGKSRSIVGDLLKDGLINDSKVASDAEIQKSKISGLTTDLANINTSLSNLQTELDGTQTGAGLSATGTYVPNASLPIIGAATSLFNADSLLAASINSLQTELNNNLSTSISNLQTELNTTQTGAGLTSTGTYSPNTNLPFINTATSLFNADAILAQELKDVIDEAVSANTANAIVRRDANGAFSAGAITATSFVGGTISGAEETPGSITTTYSDSYYIDAATNFHHADMILDAQIAAINAKRTFYVYLDNAAGGETFLAKPNDAPAIPDNNDVEVYIDGRKVRKGTNKVFTVRSDGSGIDFAPLAQGQDLELKYVAYDGANTPDGIAIRIGEISAGTTFTNFSVAVAATATQINTPSDTLNRIYTVQNTSTSNIYIGSTNSVTTTNGFLLYPDDVFQITLTTSGQLWAVTESGTANVTVIKGH